VVKWRDTKSGTQNNIRSAGGEVADAHIRNIE
jgi:hypothetical protein